MTTTDAAPVGVSLSVPESWWEFDIRPDGRESTIRSLVDERTREVPELPSYRSDLTNMLRKMAKDAHDSGAIYMGWRRISTGCRCGPPSLLACWARRINTEWPSPPTPAPSPTASAPSRLAL